LANFWNSVLTFQHEIVWWQFAAGLGGFYYLEFHAVAESKIKGFDKI